MLIRTEPKSSCSLQRGMQGQQVKVDNSSPKLIFLPSLSSAQDLAWLDHFSDGEEGLTMMQST